MNRKDTIHKLLKDAVLELFGFIKDSESKFKDQDRWVPADSAKILHPYSNALMQFVDLSTLTGRLSHQRQITRSVELSRNI